MQGLVPWPPLLPPHARRWERSEALLWPGGFHSSAACQPCLQAYKVPGAGLSPWKLTTAPCGLSMGCQPTGRGQKLGSGERGHRDDKELGF